MLHQPTLGAILLIAIASPLVSATCTADRPVELCCRTVEPYYENEYVFQEVCNITVSDPNELTGSFCEPESPSVW